jgi:hypothetical protein
MLYAVHPQAELGVEDTGDEEADGVLGDATMPRRAIIKSSPVRIFLDSGCLAGNYIREDIAHMLAKGHPNFFTPVITNVCGAFGECQLSKKTLNVKVKIFEDDSSKVFVTTFKVLRKLPYEAIIGRKDMVVHRLTLANNYAIEPLPGERRAGHSVTVL